MYAQLRTNYADVLNITREILNGSSKQKRQWKRLASMPLVEKVVLAVPVFIKAHEAVLERMRRTGTRSEIAEGEEEVQAANMIGLSGLYELAWATQKNPPVIFMESLAFCERLLAAKVEIASFDCPLPEHFALMIPQGFKLDGHTLNSGVCSIVRGEDLNKQLQNIPHNTTNAKISECFAQFNTSNNLDGDELCCVIRLSVDKSPPVNMSFTLHGNEEYINRVLQTPVKELNCTDGMVKLVMSLIVYTQAVPEHIKEGIHVKTNSLLATKSNNQIMVTEKKFKREPLDHTAPLQPFFRRWHFKTLRHERYYHGVHEHKARGSRVIFVNAAMVGKTDNATVVDVD